jgi:hypothetical protein
MRERGFLEEEVTKAEWMLLKIILTNLLIVAPRTGRMSLHAIEKNA